MAIDKIDELKFISKLIVTTSGIFLPFLAYFVDRLNTPKSRWALLAVLHIFAAWSLVIYFDFGHWRFDRYMNPHDVYHYYVGAKYSPELGYSGLYEATLAADMEGEAKYSRNNKIRDLESYDYIPVKNAIIRAADVKSRFSDQRWDEFKKDISFFQSRMPDWKWNKLLKDKGYNASPIWNMVARWITEAFPSHGPLGLDILVGFDLLLMALAFGFIGRAFGYRAMLFSVIFFGVNFFMSFVNIKGAFLRLDWLAALIISISLVKLAHYKTAGVVASYAVAARIFPVIFLFGLGAKMLWCLFSDKTLPRKHVKFFSAFTIFLFILLGASIIDAQGLGLWREFLHKIQTHNQDITPLRIGFKYIFLNTWDKAGAWSDFEQSKVSLFESTKPIWWMTQALILIIFFILARRLKNHKTFAFGFVPVFFLVAPTFYYYVMLSAPLLFFLNRKFSASQGLGISFMFAVSTAGYTTHRFLGLGLKHSYIMSWLLFAICLTLVVSAALTEYIQFSKTRNFKSIFHRILVRYSLGGASAGALLGLVLVSLLWTIASFEPRNIGDFRNKKVAELVFVGDVMFDRVVERDMKKHNRTCLFHFEKTKNHLKSAHISFCNLETPISTEETPIDKKYTFNSNPKCLSALERAGFDVVSLANNHVLDYGPKGLEQTIKNLKKSSVAQIGISNDESPQRPVIIEANGIKVGYLAYADPGQKYSYAREFLQYSTKPAKLELETVQRDVKALRDEVDIVVVSLHWGVEYRSHNSRQEKIGKSLIDMGVDIVAGHHPHVQQDAEWYRNGLIIYSMGNFVFDQRSRPATRISRLFKVIVDKKGVVDAEYLPLEIPLNRWQPTPTSETFITVN